MNKLKKQNEIFKKIIPTLENGDFTDFNLDTVLKEYSIKEADFYYLFPYKTKSLCKYFLFNIASKSIKSNVEKTKHEKSISKNIFSTLEQFIRALDKEKKISFFFIDYLIRNPLLFKKFSYCLSNNIWQSINDKSVDFNFYTKRLILSQILINSIIHYKGSKSLNDTSNFIKIQIQALGKFGYYKSKIKGYLSSLTKSNFLSKFDFMH